MKMRKKRRSRWSLSSLLLSESRSPAHPETWGTLERMTHKEGPAFAQCCFLPLFSSPVHTSVASLYVVVFFTTCLVSKVHI